MLDALLAHKGSATDIESPVVAEVSPTAPAALLEVSVALVGSDWTVTAPSDDVIDAARTELMLDAGAPVPLEVGVGVRQRGADRARRRRSCVTSGGSA